MLRSHVVTISFLLVAVSGCAQLTGQKPDALTTELATDKPVRTSVPAHPTTPEDQPISVKHGEGTKSHVDATISPGTGRLINYEAAAQPAGAGVRGGEGEVTFNFENQPIQAVVQSILGALLNENYTISPNVTGNVTFSTSKPISAEQALPVLEMLLAWTNNALVRKQGRYEVIPVKEAVAGNLSPGVGAPKIAAGYQVRVFPLKYISASEMQKLLKPYAKGDAVISADNARAMIVLAGTAYELQNYEHTINVFDVDWLKGMSVGVFGLRNVEVTKIMPELDKIFGDKSESPLGGMFRFIPMETTNSVIVITPQPEYLKRAQEWLYRLDVGVGENGTQLYVYDVKNVKAVDLSDHLNAIFTGRSSGTKSTSGNTAPGLKSVNIGGTGGATTGGINATNYSTGLSQNRSTPNTQGNLTTTGTGAPTGAGGKETDIRITAIEENNQLLIMATPGEYDSILAAVHRLDILPYQVQIEAKVLEVTLSGDLEFGVQWWLAGLVNNSNAVPGSSTGNTYSYPFASKDGTADRTRSSLGGSSPPSVNGGNGLFYSFLNKNFQVALNALQTNGNTKILSAPSMVVLNNQEAQITVGTQIPIVQTSILGYSLPTTTTTTGTAANTGTNTGIGQVSYISTGVTLDVKPRVNPGGLVYMEVSQEVSAPGPAAAGANPPISQRQLQTQIAVQSGQTVLLGGLISENDIDSTSGVPGLTSIPLLGRLFGNTSKTRQRTEIIVLITPQVITNSEDARTMTEEYQSKFESLAPLRAKKAAESSSAPNSPPTAQPEPAPSAAPKH